MCFNIISILSLLATAWIGWRQTRLAKLSIRNTQFQTLHARQVAIAALFDSLRNSYKGEDIAKSAGYLESSHELLRQIELHIQKNLELPSNFDSLIASVRTIQDKALNILDEINDPNHERGNT